MTLKKHTPIKIVALTDTATTQIKKLTVKQGSDDKNFRVYITGGGCSGFEYGFMLDSKQEDDNIVKYNGVQVLIDSLSMQYLRGATVDYTQNLSGSSFSIKNPNATTTCSCGSSFSVA